MGNHIREYVLDLPEKSFQEFYIAVLWRSLMGKDFDSTKLPEHLRGKNPPDNEAMKFVKEGRIIEAIKQYRKVNNSGLRESKDMINFFRFNEFEYKGEYTHFFNLVEETAIKDNFDKFVIRSVMLRNSFAISEATIEEEIRKFRENETKKSV